jgi:putative oxidoreductase
MELSAGKWEYDGVSLRGESPHCFCVDRARLSGSCLPGDRTFLVIGVEKLTGTIGTIPFFRAIGRGQWFRYASGVPDTAGALLIVFPRWTCYGALIVTSTVGLGTVLCSTMALFNPLFPLGMTLLAASLAWLTRPGTAV